MRLLHLYWPHLLLRLACSRSSTPFAAVPIVLGGKPWTNGPVLDASRSALELGVRPGMPLGAAHRLAPEALFLDPDPAAEGISLETALDRLAGFSPGVAAETDERRPGFGRVEVQLDGLERLWGPESLVVQRIGEALAGTLPGPPLAGIGGTRFAAAVAATRAGLGGVAQVVAPAVAPAVAQCVERAGRRGVAPTVERAGPGQAPVAATLAAAGGEVPLHVVEPGTDAAFLAPLPAGLLSRDPEVRARLERFGLRVIGQVAELPRSAMVARFGPDGELIHARSRGEETDPFRPRRAPERMAMALPIDPPVADVEGLRFVLHRLTAAFGDQLEARGAAAARARLTLELDRSFSAGELPPLLTVDQHLPEPTSEGLAIERLLIARLETAPPPAPVSRVDLELCDVAPAAGCQLTLFTPQTGRTGRLGWQLARLGLRFGEERIGWMELEDPEAPLAEARWTWRRQPAGGDRASASAATPSRVPSGRRSAPPAATPSRAQSSGRAAPPAATPSRAQSSGRAAPPADRRGRSP
jgi:protein ImuB